VIASVGMWNFGTKLMTAPLTKYVSDAPTKADASGCANRNIDRTELLQSADRDGKHKLNWDLDSIAGCLRNPRPARDAPMRCACNPRKNALLCLRSRADGCRVLSYEFALSRSLIGPPPRASSKTE